MSTDKKQLLSKDFIFQESPDGKLIFHGDFDGFYQDEEDPWDQSGQGEPDGYYAYSRERVTSWLNKLDGAEMLEVGCGLGFSTKALSDGCGRHVDGIDISSVAIEKAKAKFSDLHFEVADICSATMTIKKQYDVVVLNQLLWYLLEDLDQVMINCHHLLKARGHLIISNAFAREQRYGKEFIDGFEGAFRYFSNVTQRFSIRHAQYNDDGHRNTDGLFVLAKLEV